MIPTDIFAANSLIWPLCFLLCALLVLRQVRDDVRPIFRGIVGGLAIQSQRNSVAWAMVLLIATLGSMQALIEVAHENQWPFVEALAKIFTPFIAGLVAGSRASPMQATPVATVNLAEGETTSKVTVEQTTKTNPL